MIGVTKFFKKYSKIAESQNTALYFLTSVFHALIGIITLPIYTKFLSPAEFGIWGVVIAFNNFLLPIFQLGLNTFYIKEYYNDRQGDKTLFSSLFFFTFLWSILLIIIGVLVGPWLFDITAIDFDFFPFMFLILISNLSVCCFTYLPLRLRIESKALKYSGVLILKTILITVISLILVMLYDQALLGRVYGFVFGNIIFMGFCIPFLKKYLIFRLDFKLIQSGIKACLPLVPAILATLLFDTFDRIFLEKFRSLEEVGYYNVGSQYAGMITMAFMSFYKAVEPKIFEWSSTKDYKSLKNLFSTIAIILAIGSLVSIILAAPFLNILVASNFLTAIPIARYLILVVFMQGIYLLLSTYNVSLYRNKYVMLIAITGLTIFVITMYFLAPVFGAQGVAIAKSISYLLMTMAMWISVDKPSEFWKFIGIAIVSYICLFSLILFL